MRFSTFAVLALASSAIATNPIMEKLRALQARQDNSSTADSTAINAEDTAAKLSVFISILGLTGTATIPTAIPTCLGGYEAPPLGLYGAILTAVPGSILGQLANGAGRSSISAAFAAGSTPAWYAAMPTEVQAYIVSLKDHKGTGCTAPATTSYSSWGAGAPKAGVTGGEGVFVDENAVETSTSSDFAMATGVAKGSLAGVVAFVGLMAVL